MYRDLYHQYSIDTSSENRRTCEYLAAGATITYSKNTMFAYIQGTIRIREATALIVCAGDIGYRIFVCDDVLSRAEKGDAIELFLFHYLRENSAELYGFRTYEEYEFFSLLLSVSGVGPKTALSVLRIASIKEIQDALSKGDATLLKKVSGIGSKTAERIVVELKEKFRGVSLDGSLRLEDETIVDALLSLGYSQSQARKAAQALPSDDGSIQDRLKEALKIV